MPGTGRAMQAERELGRINAFFPILPALGNRWALARPWEGKTIALNLHLSTLTACLLRELALGGGTFVVSSANPKTADPAAVDLLRGMGCTVYTGGDLRDRHKQVLSHRPDFIVDSGFELLGELLRQHATTGFMPSAAVEVSRTGIVRMRAHSELPLPVVNLNDGELRERIETRHGAGEAIWQAVATTTGMHLAGRRGLVLGYGPVGRGVASYARAAGMVVEVCEADPVRRLFAHYDGFVTPTLEDGLSRAGIVVTATGVRGVLPYSALHHACNDSVFLNAGHGGDEIDVDGIKTAALNTDQVSEHVTRYTLPNGTRATVLADGHPLNVVLNSGSPEPVLLTFGLLGLTLERLAAVADSLQQGETPITDAIEGEAAKAALDALKGGRA